jgi:flagellar hook-associated protein 2
MAGLSSPGIGSGLDIKSIVNQLMAVEQQPLTALATKEASFQAKISAYGSLKGALSTLQTAVKTLTRADAFTGRSAGVSDATVLSATAADSAADGTYSISVDRLAKFHTVRSNGNYAATTETFNTGTLSLSVGGSAVDIEIDETNNTLAGIRQAINDSDAGVTAAIIDDGSYQRLVLTSTKLGSDGSIGVTVTDSGSGGDNALAGLDSASLVEVQAADDAQVTINNLTITRSSNTISDVIEGLTLNLSKTGTTSVTVAQNTGKATAAVDAFVKAYNDVVKQIKAATAYDVANKKASTLTGDSTARSIQSQLSSLVQSSVGGIAGGLARLSDVGISVQKDGTLAFTTSKLTNALGDPTKDVGSLFTQTTASNTGIAVRFDDWLNNVVGSKGSIASRLNGIDASIKEIGRQRETLAVRLQAVEKRYRAQFTALDSLVASMNQTSQYLSQQLANLPGASSSSS